MNNERISYKVIANVGTLAKYPTGWSKEVNIVSWNEGPAKLDIRDWSEDHEKMSRGITLNADEVQRLIDSVQSRDAIAMLTGRRIHLPLFLFRAVIRSRADCFCLKKVKA